MRLPPREAPAERYDVATAAALSAEDCLEEAATRRHAADARLADCVRRMAKGDQGALAEVYDATVNRIYSVALRFVRDQHVAEEVVSDVFFQAWSEAGRYNVHRGTVRTWLLVCCRSRALDALRRRDAPHAGIDPDELDERQDDDAALGTDILELIERDSAVHHALERITPIERQLIALSFFRGYSHAEIARREDMPLGSVKTHIRTALRRLRVVLSGLRP